MSSLALSDAFEYLCYGSTAIRNIFTLYSAGIDFTRQNLTSTDVRFRRLKSIPALLELNRHSVNAIDNLNKFIVIAVFGASSIFTNKHEIGTHGT